MAEESTTKDKIYLCKYKVETLILMKGDEKIELDHSNILNIEYMNDYEFNLRAIIKIRLRMDVRKRLWVLKNKKDVICKFELNKFGMDPEIEETVTGIENVWNQEFSIYLNDEDDSNDAEVMEQRIKKNEGEEFKSNDLKDENYFESQNTFDIYLFNQTLLNASQKTFNHVFTKNTLQQMVGRMLTETKHNKVLMSKFENDEIYSELLVPAHPLYKDLIYMDQYYGFYKKGAIIYYDWDVLYLLNGNGKVTAKREGEWTETIFMVTKIDESTPGNGMIRKEGEKKFYIGITDMNINPKKFTIGHNIDIGSEAKVINSLISEGCQVFGNSENSILFDSVYVGKNSVVKDSVIMPNVRIGDNVIIEKAIIASDAVINNNLRVGSGSEIAVVPEKQVITKSV